MSSIKLQPNKDWMKLMAEIRSHSLNQNGCYTSESDRYPNNDDPDGDGDFNSQDHCNGKPNNIQGFP